MTGLANLLMADTDLFDRAFEKGAETTPGQAHSRGGL